MLRTAKQRKELCAECPVARVANVLGDSCTLLILRDLLESPRRFSDLETSLSGISTRTLTNKLKLLEREHLVQRSESRTSTYAQYVLTTNGRGLRKIIEAMRKYGKKYLWFPCLKNLLYRSTGTGGTFFPFLRAFDKPIAIACLRLFTSRPLRPLCALPRLYACISFSTSFDAPLEYLLAIFLMFYYLIILLWIFIMLSVTWKTYQAQTCASGGNRTRN